MGRYILYCHIYLVILIVCTGTALTVSSCQDGSFSCKNSKGTHSDCIDLTLVCDEVCDCDNCDDEIDCNIFKPSYIQSEATTTRSLKPVCSSHFWCSNNRCLYFLSLVCDGMNDCTDNSDERSCAGCESGSFSCNNGISTHSDCIDPVLVCDKVCDCDTCEDEKECYYDKTTTTTTTTSNQDADFDFVYILVVPGIIGVFLIILSIVAVKCITRKKTPSRNEGNRNLSYVTTEQQLQQQYQTEIDSPPDYETVNDDGPVNDGPVFSVSPSLYSNDSNDQLPTYDEINILMVAPLHGEVNASMATEEDAEQPPPSYDTVTENLSTNIASTESNSTDGDIDGDSDGGSVIFRRSSSHNEVNVPMDDQLQGEINLSMATEEDAEPPPPSYDTVTDIFNTNVSSTESISPDTDSLRSCSTDISSHST